MILLINKKQLCTFRCKLLTLWYGIIHYSALIGEQNVVTTPLYSNTKKSLVWSSYHHHSCEINSNIVKNSSPKHFLKFLSHDKHSFYLSFSLNIVGHMAFKNKYLALLIRCLMCYMSRHNNIRINNGFNIG